jgi:hypothetical protein
MVCGSIVVPAVQYSSPTFALYCLTLVIVDAPFTGKFMPIRQWFYYDAVEALHDTPLPAEEVAPRGCRYDGQIMVFGRSIQVRVHAVL